MLQKLLLPGLLIYYFLQQRAKAALDQFQYRLNGFKVKTFQGLKLVPNFGIYNPTSANINIKRAGLSVNIEGNQIAQYSGVLNTTIAPGWNDLELNFTVKGLGAANVVYQLGSGAKFKTGSITGTLTTTAGNIPVNYTFTNE